MIESQPGYGRATHEVIGHGEPPTDLRVDEPVADDDASSVHGRYASHAGGTGTSCGPGMADAEYEASNTEGTPGPAR
jgi:hypothetical protein